MNRDLSVTLLFLVACISLLLTCLLWNDHLDVSAHITLASQAPTATSPAETPPRAAGVPEERMSADDAMPAGTEGTA
jgi:hypothetical protein